MGGKNGFFFQYWQLQRPYEDILTNGININRSILFRHFDTFFIQVQKENHKLFICQWSSIKDFIGPVTVVK